MSAALFLKRFLQRPKQVASIVPSSKVLIDRVAGKFDFSKPRIIVEFGPGEGCTTREFIRRMHPDSTLVLFELDAELAGVVREQFRHDKRIHVLNTDASNLGNELAALGIQHCDYVVSGIPFSTMEVGKKRELLKCVHRSLAPNPESAFIIYQVTNELRGHTKDFPRVESEYCIKNFPPYFITVFYKQVGPSRNGNGVSHHGHNGHGHSHNGNGASFGNGASNHGVNGNGAAHHGANGNGASLNGNGRH